MLKKLRIKNFTVFTDVDLLFGQNLNIIIGENGAGKSHILKLIYSALAVASKRRMEDRAEHSVPSKAYMEVALAEKLKGVFRPDSIGRLASRRQGHTTCELDFQFQNPNLDMACSFSTRTKSTVKLDRVPSVWLNQLPVYLPTRELLTIFPGFVSLYDNTETSFEETWRDTCSLLGHPLSRGERLDAAKPLLSLLEEALGGKVMIHEGKNFYLVTKKGKMEMQLVAEGHRKLAMLAFLVANGSLLDKSYLFWDEPESNLNPRLIKTVAAMILQLADNGIQVFIASHSLFLMRELYILQQRDFQEMKTRCFGLQLMQEGEVSVQQGATMDDIGEIASLEEDLSQSERYMDFEMGVVKTN